MKPLYILKIGGSVVTYKNRTDFSVRKALLKKIARAIKYSQKKKGFDLILIHGAGSFGHQLAHKYKLRDGVGNDPKKMRGSLLSRLANQKLNIAISEAFLSEGVPVASAHTGSVVIQRDKKIIDLNLKIIKESLKNGCVPVLYGEMVFDETLGMSICSGDVISPYLAEKMKAQKMFFASDIDGVFDKDPYKHKDAILLERIDLAEIKNGNGIEISGSHNIDVTGGLFGKIRSLEFEKGSRLESVEIFNGLKAENYTRIFLGEKFPHSKIFI